jgi:uncharacterized membrane protein
VAAAGAALAWRGLGGWSKLYEALGIDRAGAGRTVGNLGVKIDRDVVVAEPAERLYRFWADAGAQIERDLREFKRALESGRLAA